MHSTTPKSPTEWWNLLHDLKSNAQWDDPDQYVKLDDLTNFFRSLYNDSTLSTDAETNPHLVYSCAEHFSNNPPTPELTQLPIEAALTSAEILSHLHKLKNGKATGLDLLSNEMLSVQAPYTCHSSHNSSTIYITLPLSLLVGKKHILPPSTKRAPNTTRQTTAQSPSLVA